MDKPAEGTSEVIIHDGQEVALFNVQGKLYVVTNRCPHRSGPLSKGQVEKSGESVAVRCPIHGWLFDLATGECLTRPSASIQTYPVSCEEGNICLGPARGQVTGPSAPLVG